MRTLSLTAALAGSLLLLAPAAMAQQQDQGGWRGTIDQLNRTVNPDTQRDDRRAREVDRNRDGRIDERTDGRDRRMEGSSGSSSGRNDRASSELRRYSDEDIRDRFSRLGDEQRQLQRERRALEDEMERRGMRRQ